MARNASVSSIDLQDIDIMSDSLSLLGEDPASFHDDGLVKYGDLVLNIAPKEGKALTLLADQLFSPSLLIAERIELGLIPLEGKKVVELGAGCALPSLLAATLPQNSPSHIVITDYPDEAILANLRINLTANQRLFSPGCSVVCVGHEWGEDAKPVLDTLPTVDLVRKGFDVVILSDLLHYHNSHIAILESLVRLLLMDYTSRAYIACGTYTPPHVCSNFLRLSEKVGLLLEEGPLDDVWRGKKEVWRMGALNANVLGVRKGMCRWWVARWKDSIVHKSTGKDLPI